MFDWRICIICIILCAVQAEKLDADATQLPKANGNDEVRKPNGNDEVQKPTGNDEVQKPTGNDEVRKPNGNDKVQKPNENDEVQKPNGNDEVRKPNGNDEVQKPNENDEVQKPNENDEVQEPNENDEVQKPNENDEVQKPNGIDMVREANGIDVVRAAVLKIRNSCIFPHDYGFLLRVALVESNFGADPNTFRSDAASGGKGIWQINQTGFDDTKFVSKYTLLYVKKELGVDWVKMTFTSDNMNVPLYNALAARLLLYRKAAEIPSSLTEQAAFWKKYFNTAAGTGTETGFINKVNSTKTCNAVGADLLFVLNSHPYNGNYFELMKQVVVDVANKLTIGTHATQIAVLLTFPYGDRLNTFINFTSYSTVGDLTSAIKALAYKGYEDLNKNASINSLKHLEKLFHSTRLLDAGFPRVLIFLTENTAQYNKATREAKNLSAFSWLHRYAVGMGSGINEAELQTIASGCSRVYLIQSESAISALTDELYDVACRSSIPLPPPESALLPPPQPGTEYSKMTGTLAPNTTSKTRDTAVSPLTGRTYALQVTSGSATLYASLTNENPSSAIHDFFATAKPNEPGVIFVRPSDLSKTLIRRRRDVSTNSATNGTANSLLYLSIVPTEGSGPVVYQLDARDGDRRSLYSKSAMGRPLNSLWPGLAAVSVLIWREF